MYGRCGVVLVLLPVPKLAFPFGDFRICFCGFLVPQICGSSFVDLAVGITHEYVVTLFSVILPLQIQGKGFDLVVSGYARVLEVETQDLQFLTIESDLGLERYP